MHIRSRAAGDLIRRICTSDTVSGVTGAHRQRAHSMAQGHGFRPSPDGWAGPCDVGRRRRLHGADRVAHRGQTLSKGSSGLSRYAGDRPAAPAAGRNLRPVSQVRQLPKGSRAPLGRARGRRDDARRENVVCHVHPQARGALSGVGARRWRGHVGRAPCRDRRMAQALSQASAEAERRTVQILLGARSP